MNNAIEVLENIIRSLYKEDWRVPKPAKMKIDALSQAIQWGKSLASAEKEIERLKKGIDAFKEMRSFDSKEYGDTLAQYRKGIAQKALRIEELRKTIQIMAEEHQKELATLKAELEEWKEAQIKCQVAWIKLNKEMKEVRQQRSIIIGSLDKIEIELPSYNELQQENAKLREENKELMKVLEIQP